VIILDLRKLETLTDFFVVCTADVDQQIRAVVRNIEDRVKTKTGERVFHREGFEGLNWVLLDYVDVVVHVFKPSFREFYKLGDLWGDADIVPVTDDATTKRKVVKRAAAAQLSTGRNKPRAKKTTKLPRGTARRGAEAEQEKKSTKPRVQRKSAKSLTDKRG